MPDESHANPSNDADGASAQPWGIVSHSTNSPTPSITPEADELRRILGKPAPRYPSHAEREELLASVQRMILKFSNAKALPPSEREDLASELTLRLWKASDKYDMDGSASWSTFAHHACGIVTRAFVADYFKDRDLLNKAGRLSEIIVDPHTDDTSDLAGLEPADAEFVNRADRELRRGVFVETLAVLKPASRRVVEMIAIDKLTINQVAHQLGQKPAIVGLTIKAAIGTLVRAGKLTPEFMRSVGADPRRFEAQLDHTQKRGESEARIELLCELPAEVLTNLTHTAVRELFDCKDNQARRALNRALKRNNLKASPRHLRGCPKPTRRATRTQSVREYCQSPRSPGSPRGCPLMCCRR